MCGDRWSFAVRVGVQAGVNARRWQTLGAAHPPRRAGVPGPWSCRRIRSSATDSPARAPRIRVHSGTSGVRLGLPTIPVIAESEACAEKLARYRRTRLARDVYDLAQFASRSIDEPLLRRLWVLKVWADVVDDARVGKPLLASDVLTKYREQDFTPESIGVLNQPIDIPGWEQRARTRFAFLADLDADEQRLALCDPRDRQLYETLVGDLRG